MRLVANLHNLQPIYYHNFAIITQCLWYFLLVSLRTQGCRMAGAPKEDAHGQEVAMGVGYGYYIHQ